MGTSASRSSGPIRGSSSIIAKTRSMTVRNSRGLSKRTPIAVQVPDVVPPAPDDVVPPAEVVPPPEELRVERDAAGLRAVAGLAAALRRAGDGEEDVEREREAVGLAAVERDDDPDAGFRAVERDDDPDAG